MAKITPDERRSIVEMAKAYAPEALEALVRVIRHPNAPPSSVVAASTALLDRGWGRPVQSLEHTGKGGGPIEFDEIAMLSPIERKQRLLALQAELTEVSTPQQHANGSGNGHANGHGA